DTFHDQIAEARRILSGLGLNEAQGQTLIGEAVARKVSVEAVALQNPLSSDMNALRPSLLPGLLDALRHNVSHKNGDVALFEIGRVFSPTTGPREERRVAVALTGRRNLTFWSGAERDVTFDIYDLKGLLEDFLENFGVRGVVYLRRSESTTLFIESATIQLGGKFVLGELGQLVPPLAKEYDLRHAVLLAELNLDTLLARRSPAKSFKPLPAYPSIRRDVAMFVAESTTHEAVLSTIKQAKPLNLESVELFDVFR